MPHPSALFMSCDLLNGENGDENVTDVLQLSVKVKPTQRKAKPRYVFLSDHKLEYMLAIEG